MQPCCPAYSQAGALLSVRAAPDWWYPQSQSAIAAARASPAMKNIPRYALVVDCGGAFQNMESGPPAVG
jgi:hypothetical protein